MTREEAIKILKTERYCQEDTPNLKRVRKAYDMAISALTHEIRTETHGVCLISRTADCIIENVLSADAEQVTGKLKNPCDSLLTGDSDECKEQKSKLESADAVQGWWIPLAHDGLGTNFPYEHDGEWVIVTDGNNISVERIKKDAYDHFFPNGRWFELDDAIAWMQLPKPYKGGDTE